ncbi:MAG TPA: class I SAM-dependent methyltransferase [Methanocella sp.]|nr:class I SAM-dependent methyltransferase [Methanocella sp.]
MMFMDAEKVRLTKEHDTYLLTLYGKALDNRAKNPILGDWFADEVVRKIDYDFGELRIVRGTDTSVPVRAKHLDGWTREFIAANPVSTVLHLGCGLDSRIFRIDPPATVRWYDVDYPEVIELRRRLYPERHDYVMIGSSITEHGWLDEIPADRPVLVVAEGVLQYLSEQEGIALFGWITERFSGGQIIFDAYSRLMVRLVSQLFVLKRAGTSLRWGIGDPLKLEELVPRLELDTEVPFITLPEMVERQPQSRVRRAIHGIASRFRYYRRMVQHLRYRF